MDFKKPENQINFCLEQNFGKYFGYNLNLESLLFSKYDEIINEYMISYFKNNKDKALYKEFFLFIVRDFVNSGRICK